MTAVYRPAAAIALLRPSFLLPRIQPAATRRARARAAHTSTPHPTTPPQPQRKSITLSGDTGQVRWSDLSPGEKAVRTTQQSVNLAVVAVGIFATVRLCCCAHPAKRRRR
jgi:import inner membrane translocase subunit TIM21